MAQNGLNNEETMLFDPEILLNIDYNAVNALMSSAGTDFKLRPLNRTDFSKGYLKLLQELTTVGEISQKQFEAQFDKMKLTSDGYFIIVIEHVPTQTIVGSSSLVIEHKFIRNCAKRARLEDVVVSSNQRGKQLGKILVETVKALSVYNGCYKISLDCKDTMVPYYESLGYKKEPGNANTLVIRHNL
ncbi:probable glucosamine 6-phosphate N-acetyltransferase [Artemia franciscana]|uniref:Glucosamine 6-phosphate N-acetyltransferase n=1 Tax=Artemia franciscana TaxID=6661 RepID=A0AA88HSL2_ARTSF|nr:hypothetical protein QYM36_013695 [Artemia franciscana]KAK2710106.1 hypothetical protein QYM36_013695 [Artemia franciscana]KAK2710107.1 hypothetical protein QYM36_013695 [Artemia franciscana]KAK2710108.1 hypothetical protein QYM36_013695 [Artemia franciscana]CAG4635782.1 EOG090X0FKI [Artemia franciscana]